MEIVIASSNVHKVREIRAMLKTLRKFDIYSLHDFPDYQPPEFNVETFEDLAIQKAVHAAQSIKKLTIADASGLVVPALNGLPGIHSSRYAHKTASDKENRQKLLFDMKNFQEADRYAYLECCLALASPQGLLKSAKGVSEGVVIDQERGSNGYGYDSIFLKHDYSKTFAELEEDTKIRISHRRKAFDKILLTLENISEDALLYRRV